MSQLLRAPSGAFFVARYCRRWAFAGRGTALRSRQTHAGERNADKDGAHCGDRFRAARLGALEALSQRLTGTEGRIQIDIYEPGPHPGAGPNFAPSEPAYCLLNIPNRDIAIRPPKGSLVGHFAEWQDRAVDPDSFPSRAEMGRYLMARREDLFARGFTKTGVTCRVIPAAVDRISPEGAGWRVQSESGAEAPYDEVLLTLGQPPVEPDAQWADWQEHAARREAEVAQAIQRRICARGRRHGRASTSRSGAWGCRPMMCCAV
ncbi:FAD/NAD(P)-binding protein [Sulfitobacter sp. 15WGC]|nr:FAD/NAD(P)-binding protein [Sulfitobacter sp. 15WGC]